MPREPDPAIFSVPSLTQPLDVGFFSPLQQSWQKSVIEFDFDVDNPGLSVEKTTFSRVFKKAHLAAVKPGNIVRAFENSGIYPPNRHAFDDVKTIDSLQEKH